MSTDDHARLERAVRSVSNFPEQGIAFKDLSPILADPELFALARDALLRTAHPFVDGQQVDAFAGIDARGFLFASAVAAVEGAGVVLVRKDGKLPDPTMRVTAVTEYSEVTLCLDPAMFEGRNIVLVDDILATGGTAIAAAGLIEKAGGKLLGSVFFGEIAALSGRERLWNQTGTPAAVVLTL